MAERILFVTLRELFEWRFMQTDPNWGNFLYNSLTDTLSLIDFGASRDYDKSFVDEYIRVVWSAANKDEETMMQSSLKLGFITGWKNMHLLM